MMTKGEIALKDLFNIGAAKPMGFLPRTTITHHCGLNVTDLQAELERKGLRTLILSDRDSLAYLGALYAWDEAALAGVIQTHAPLLQSKGWPVDPEGFVRRMAGEWVNEMTPLYDVIADAFGDRDNPFRHDKSQKSALEQEWTFS